MAKNEHETSLPSIEEGVTVTGKVKKKAAHLQCAKVTKGTVSRWTNRGVSNWHNFEDADWPVGGEDKPSGWAFTTRRSGFSSKFETPCCFVVGVPNGTREALLLVVRIRGWHSCMHKL